MHHSPHIYPADALEMLKSGNMRFADGLSCHPHADAERRGALRGCQSPFATILTCSDSRVPPEIIFDCGLGDLFVIRVAGNCVDTSVMGSILYAVHHLACPLIVVLGHQSCGAVTASLAPDEDLPGDQDGIMGLYDIIRRNIPASIGRDAADRDNVTAAIHENVRAVTGRISSEPEIAAAAGNGNLMVMSAYYSFETGEVSWV